MATTKAQDKRRNSIPSTVIVAQPGFEACLSTLRKAQQQAVDVPQIVECSGILRRQMRVLESCPVVAHSDYGSHILDVTCFVPAQNNKES